MPVGIPLYKLAAAFGAQQSAGGDPSMPVSPYEFDSSGRYGIDEADRNSALGSALSLLGAGITQGVAKNDWGSLTAGLGGALSGMGDAYAGTLDQASSRKMDQRKFQMEEQKHMTATEIANFNLEQAKEEVKRVEAGSKAAKQAFEPLAQNWIDVINSTKPKEGATPEEISQLELRKLNAKAFVSLIKSGLEDGASPEEIMKGGEALEKLFPEIKEGSMKYMLGLKGEEALRTQDLVMQLFGKAKESGMENPQFNPSAGVFVPGDPNEALYNQLRNEDLRTQIALNKSREAQLGAAQDPEMTIRMRNLLLQESEQAKTELGAATKILESVPYLNESNIRFFDPTIGFKLEEYLNTLPDDSARQNFLNSLPETYRKSKIIPVLDGKDKVLPAWNVISQYGAFKDQRPIDAAAIPQYSMDWASERQYRYMVEDLQDPQALEEAHVTMQDMMNRALEDSLGDPAIALNRLAVEGWAFQPDKWSKTAWNREFSIFLNQLRQAQQPKK